MNSEPYAFGRICMWHGPLTFAKLSERLDELGREIYLCPHCELAVIVTTPEAFWNTARSSEKAIPEYVEMLRWSQGKCFQDFRMMQDAYRQAMEGMA